MFKEMNNEEMMQVDGGLILWEHMELAQALVEVTTIHLRD